MTLGTYECLLDADAYRLDSGHWKNSGPCHLFNLLHPAVTLPPAMLLLKGIPSELDLLQERTTFQIVTHILNLCQENRKTALPVVCFLVNFTNFPYS